MVKKYRLVIVIFLIGVGFSFWLNNKQMEEHNAADKKRFSELSEQRFIAFSRALEENFSFINYLSQFFQTRENISQLEFKQLTQNFLELHTEIHAILWAPKITSTEMDSYLDSIAEGKLTEHYPYEYDAKGKIIPAKFRKVYYPVRYAEPFLDHQQGLGFDLASNPDFFSEIEKSNREKNKTISHAFTLQNHGVTLNNILVIATLSPIYEQQNNNKILKGYIVMVLKLADFFESAIDNVFDAEGLSIGLEEVTTDKHLVGTRWDNSKASVDSYYQEEIIDTGGTNDISVEYEGRLWRLKIMAKPHFNEKYTVLDQYNTLIFGSLITLLVTLMVYFQQRQNTNIRIKVDQRTKELALSEAVSRSILETAVDAILSINEKGIISRYNQAAEKLLGYSEQEIMGQNIMLILPDCSSDNENCYIKGANLGQGRESTAVNKQGEKIPVSLAISDTEFPGDTQYTCMMHDLSEIKAAQKVLENLSQIDGLTQLTNRRHFDELLEKEWHRALREHIPVSIIMIDIDHFKLFNDHYGHTEGDNCLKLVSKSLLNSFNRASDVVGRYGGEEFIILLPNTDKPKEMVEKCCNQIEALSIPHHLSSSSEYVTVSLGVNTIIPNTDISILDFISQADKALYDAKKSGRNQFKCFNQIV